MNIIKINNKNFKENVSYVQEEIKKGGIIICPTDTVYGILCDGLDTSAKKRIYDFKKRPKEKPLIGFVSELSKAKKFAEIESNHESLLQSKWPGPYTFIFKSKLNIPFLTSQKGEIGLRIPDYPFLLEVLQEIEVVASTSANFSSEKSPCSLDEIPDELKEKVSVVIDGGKIKGKESVIWKISGGDVKLIRG